MKDHSFSNNRMTRFGRVYYVQILAPKECGHFLSIINVTHRIDLSSLLLGPPVLSDELPVWERLVLLQYVCLCVDVCLSEHKKKREKKRKGEAEWESGKGWYPRGLKPKPLDISDLEGKWVKNKKEPGKRRRKIKRWKERERERRELSEGSWKTSRILCSNQP